MAGYQGNHGNTNAPSGGGRYGNDDGMAYGYGERVPGARRQKMLGYLRAANELRQSYQSTLSQRYLGDDDTVPPGGFPDMDVVRSGDEELLLFPSYARKHIKRKHAEHVEGGADGRPGQSEWGAASSGDGGDADYWRREWERHEDKNAVVDVDVRGWIYSPQKGPLTRRNRLLLAVARRLSGIPAPDQNPSTGQNQGLRARVHDSMMSQEEEAAAREADIIARHGQQEIEAAAKGDYSSSSRGNTPEGSRSASPSLPGRHFDDETLQKRGSWSLQTNEMSREELARANEQLMIRLRPFMTIPLANAPITVFFFNEQKSQSKSVTTDESGHFNLRAALDFVPSQVRVLASEDLSAVEDVIVTESQGISLVSDIDDTIKHSAIASGAKEIFKNTFIRELGDLTIQGVKEWYMKMADLGVKLHYVSNSPWQLFPLLRTYFKLAGLPPGSMHLKQYTGMLQGIFEPAAERKRGSLERIMHDFPERRFILVGDSGEADLEVYTDVVLANPGRVLGVFIRDVTSAFEQATAASSGASHTPPNASGLGRPSNSAAARPSLPERPKTMTSTAPAEADLIDFDDEPEPQDLKRRQTSSSYAEDLESLRLEGRPSSQPPTRPAKPSNLRSFSTSGQQPKVNQGSGENFGTPSSADTRRTPPLPPKPRRSGRAGDTTSGVQDQIQRPSFSSTQSDRPPEYRPTPPPRTPSSRTQSSTYSSYSQREDEGYLASARRQLATAYNALPPIRSTSPSADSGSSSPPRRGLSSYPAAAARWATGAAYGDPAAGGDGGIMGATYNKKEEMWKRRWARSEDIMKRNGVVLRTWRVGSDVMGECIRLVEKAQAASGR